MNTINLQYKNYPTAYDVLVVGGGTAGAVAAMAAGREGAKTLLIEREYGLGGSATLGQTMPKMTHHMTQDVENSSLADELQRRVIEAGCGSGKIWFSPHLTKYVLEDMCKDYNVDILYGADFINVIKEGDRIVAAIFQTVDGLYAIQAKSFIDATGNASVALEAGCQVEGGNHKGENQPMTLRFSLCNIDVPKAKQFFHDLGLYPDMNCEYLEIASLWRFENNPLTELFAKAVEEGILTKRDGNYFQAFSAPGCGEDVMYFNCPEAGHILNATDPKAITEMVLYSRQAARRLWQFMKTYIGGFENCIIQSFAEIPGIRESRRVVGKYVVTEHDFNNRLKTDEAISQTAYPIDIHGGEGLHMEKMQVGEYYEIPIQALMTNEISNLLVAGRCISATFVAQASLRIQLACMATGEAAGIAVACNPEAPTTVSGAKVRGIMQQYGGTFVDR